MNWKSNNPSSGSSKPGNSWLDELTNEWNKALSSTFGQRDPAQNSITAPPPAYSTNTTGNGKRGKKSFLDDPSAWNNRAKKDNFDYD